MKLTRIEHVIIYFLNKCYKSFTVSFCNQYIYTKTSGQLVSRIHGNQRYIILHVVFYYIVGLIAKFTKF